MILYSNKKYLDDFFHKIDNELKIRKKYINRYYPFYDFTDKKKLYENQTLIREVLNPKKILSAYLKEIDNNKITISINNTQIVPTEVIFIESDSSLINTDAKLINGRKKNEKIQFKDFEFPLEDEIAMNFISNKNNLFIGCNLIGNKEIIKVKIEPWPFIDLNFLNERQNIEKFDLKGMNFLEIFKSEKIIKIKPGNWVVEKNINIPSGYKFLCGPKTRLDFINSSYISSSSPLTFIGGKNDDELIIFDSSDSTGQGIFVFETNEKSFIENVEFNNISNLSFRSWSLLGAINFYESDVSLSNVLIKNNNSEDGLNIIRSNFSIENCIFENTYSDAFDSDFSIGHISNSIFINSGNDAIDLSGSEVIIQDVDVSIAGDKGISVGEQSNVSLKNINIKDSKVGIASKDESIVFGENITINKSEIGVTAYQKKPEFGPASVKLNDSKITNTKKQILNEKKSKITFNNKIMVGTDKDVERIILDLDL